MTDDDDHNIVKLDHCPCQGDSVKQKGLPEPCCAVCPFCKKNIRMGFFVKHLGLCSRQKKSHKIV